MLVHYEVFENVRDAIRRESRLKKWNREWKMNLIQRTQSGMGRFVRKASGGVVNKLGGPP
jgi:predicted GIY-YIG superfamily endonuclease